MTGLRLGPLRLDARIGRGGMADVWAAEHVDSGVAVAVKLIRRDASPSAFRADALRNEVRALARLEHPAIVPVLDQGEISDEVAERSDGELLAHTPYFVMVRTNAGTLDDAPPPASFEALRTLLARLLSALAHAHARGVLHRDVKPSNVLLHTDARGTSSALLSDFGIAHALRAADTSGPLHAGTPQYMAPEQIAGQARDEGPHTDLYSVGCLVYRLAAGAPPFVGDLPEIRRAQMLDALPPLRAPWPVPRALSEWLVTLLAKRPSLRFPSAAAALTALRSIDAGDCLPAMACDPKAVPATSTGAPTMVPEAATAHGLAVLRRGLVQPPSADELLGIRRPSTWPRARIASTWRDLTPAPRSTRLVGAGLGLYGLRPVPLAAREDERDALWAALVDAASSQQPRIAVLGGPTGLGKTRLAEWLTETAHELGAAIPLIATHGLSGGPFDGLGAMFVRHLRTAGLAHDALEERVLGWLREIGGAGSDRDDASDLVAVLEERHERFARPRERHALIRRVLVRMAARQPLVVVLDDAPLGPDTMAFVESLLEAREPRLPMVVVLTARDEDLATRPEGLSSLGRIVASPITTEVRVEPLDALSHGRLVEELLGLEREVAREVAERTSGNPLFAIQLVGDWVQRAILVPSPSGFRLREGASARIPDDIHQVLRARVDRALSGVAPEAEEPRRVIEVAAALGTRVDRAEWRLACDASGLPSPDPVLDALVAAGLMRTGSESARFVHGMLRESLERGAADAGRLTGHHTVLAALLSQRGADPERVAHHHLAAGDLDAALPALLAAAARGVETGDVAATHRHAQTYAESLDALHAAIDDPRRARGRLLAAEAFVLTGLLDEGEIAARAIDLATADPAVAAVVGWLTGIVLQKRGDTAGALAAFERAGTQASTAGDRGSVARCLYGAAECEKLIGRFDASRAHYEASGVLFAELGQRAQEARVRTGLSDLEGRVGRMERALELAEESRVILERLGARPATAVVLNGTGDLLRKLGRLDEAEARYREALRLLVDLTSADATFVRLNLGLTQLVRGDLAGGDETLAEVEGELAASGRTVYVRMVRAMRLPGAAALEAWERFDELAADAEHTLRDGAVIDPDLAWALERATSEALARGESERALRVAALAADQWRRLGDREAALRVEAACGSGPARG